MPETNESVWQVVFATLGALATALALAMRQIIQQKPSNGRPSDRELLLKLQRDIERIEEKVDDLITRERVREEIGRQSH